MTHFRQTEASDVFGSKHNSSSSSSIIRLTRRAEASCSRHSSSHLRVKTLDHCSLNYLLCLFRHPAPFSRFPPPPKMIFAPPWCVMDDASALQTLQLTSSTSTPECVKPLEEKQINGHSAKRHSAGVAAPGQSFSDTTDGRDWKHTESLPRKVLGKKKLNAHDLSGSKQMGLILAWRASS